MKTIFTLFTSLFMSLAVMAAPKVDVARWKSTLTIRSAERGDIRVVVDGRRFEPNDNYLRIQSLDAGFHHVKVYRELNTGLFTIFGKRYEVVFSKSIQLKPRTSVTLQVDRFGNASVRETRMRSGYGRNRKGWNSNNDFQFERGGEFGDYDGGHDGRIDNGDYDGGHNGRNDNGDWDRGNGYNKAMSDFEFRRVMNAIEREWFESNKAKSATQIIQTNYLTSLQVKEILELFSHDNTKLDLAKLAYKKTVDPKNYFMVNQVFHSNRSKDELARYIRSCE